VDAEAWDQRYESSALVWSAEPNRFVEEICTGLTPGAAIDRACGEGRNTIWLAQQGWSATGVDFSQVALDKARRMAAHSGVDVEWVLSDARTVDRVISKRFDLVLFCYLQVPDTDLVEALRTGTTLLNESGRIVVIAHALDNLHRGVGGPQDPAVLPTPERVEQILCELGLDIERSGEAFRPVQTEEGQRHAVDLVVIGTAPARD
jgi:SAM-dependent methyltransferase